MKALNQLESNPVSNEKLYKQVKNQFSELLVFYDKIVLLQAQRVFNQLKIGISITYF